MFFYNFTSGAGKPGYILLHNLRRNNFTSLLFHYSNNTWVEAIVRYLVEPKQAGRVKTKLIKKMLERLNAEPERVLFPKSNLR
jgi:hypothetical protein